MIQFPKTLVATPTLTPSGEMQHRARSNPRDDYDRLKDALAKIKSENRKLKKENSQLKKQLHRNTDAKIDADVDDELEVSMVAISPAESQSEEVRHYCPRCRSQSIKEISAGVFVIRVCDGCGYRKRVLN